MRRIMRTIDIDNNYTLFEDGRVYSKKSGIYLQACISGSSGYLTYGGKLGTVHRLLANYFLGGIPSKMVVNHLDGNKLNNKLYNLEITTYQLNMQHAYVTGLAKGKPGETNSGAKLSENEYRQLCLDMIAGMNNDELSQRYNLHSRYISLIRHGKRWKHLYNEYGPFPKSIPVDKNEESKIVFQLMRNQYTNKEISEILPVDASTISLWRRGLVRKL